MKYILNNVECFHMICLAFQYVIVINSILVFQWTYWRNKALKGYDSPGPLKFGPWSSNLSDSSQDGYWKFEYSMCKVNNCIQRIVSKATVQRDSNFKVGKYFSELISIAGRISYTNSPFLVLFVCFFVFVFVFSNAMTKYVNRLKIVLLSVNRHDL